MFSDYDIMYCILSSIFNCQLCKKQNVWNSKFENKIFTGLFIYGEHYYCIFKFFSKRSVIPFIKRKGKAIFKACIQIN